MILFPKDLVATRVPCTLVKGEWIDGTPIQVPFVGDIQPTSNRDVVALNVGRHDLGKVHVFSEDPLQETSQGGTPAKGDLVTFHGNTYEVIQENTHSNGIIDHHDYIAEYRAA